MAVANNFAPGKTGTNYTPNTYEEMGNMIGKIAQQIIREVETRDPLAVFDKIPVDKGDTIEQAVIKLVEASPYDKTGAGALTRATNEKLLVRYFNNWEARKYKQTVDTSEIRKVLEGETGVDTVSSMLVGTLAQSRVYDKYTNVKALFKWATTNGSLESNSSVFKHLDDVQVNADNTLNYKAILKKIKNTVKGMKYVNTDYNSIGLARSTRESDIYILMPYTLVTDIDVDELAGVFNLDKAEIRSRIIEIDTDDTYVYIVDQNAILDYTRLYEMWDQKNADGHFWNYFLHVEDLFAVSPLFDCCYFDYAKQAG